MLLKPCLHCPHKSNCEIRDDIRARAKGLPFTVASFKCEKRDAVWRIGQRVTAEFTVLTSFTMGGYGEPREGWTSEEHIGTVIGRKDGKIVVWLDEPLDEEGKRFIVKLWPDRPDLKAAAEPDAVLCSECRKPHGREQVSAGWHCSLCNK